jgi:Glycosyltransferase family 9 (heptosyltransferase)
VKIPKTTANKNCLNQSTNTDYDIVLLLPKILGDSMMSVHALRCYPDFFKETKVLIVTESVYKNLFRIIFDDHTVKSFSEISGLVSVGKIIDFRGDEVSRSIKSNFNCGDQFAFDFGEELAIAVVKNTEQYSIKFSEINAQFDQEDMRHQHAWFMDAILVSEALGMPLRYPRQDLKQHRSSDTNVPAIKSIVCFPCGSNSLKHYPVENWLLIIEALINAGFNVSVFLGDTEKEHQAAFSALAPAFLNTPLENIVRYYFNDETLVVANDCGPLHVAALFGVKVVGIFGPTNEKIWFPYQYGQAVRGLNSEWPTTGEVLNVINHCTAI